MRDKYFYEVMFDDTSIDVSKEVGLVWSIANSLRGAYTSDKYKDVIIPMVIIRRFECALDASKDAVATGDETPVGTMMALAAASLLAGGYVLVRRRKKEI